MRGWSLYGARFSTCKTRRCSSWWTGLGTEGFVLFDSPGNVSEDGWCLCLPRPASSSAHMGAEEKHLNSTGMFVQVVNALRQATPKCQPELLFSTNRLDVRIGTADELKMWKQTDAIFGGWARWRPRIHGARGRSSVSTRWDLSTPTRCREACFRLHDPTNERVGWGGAMGAARPRALDSPKPVLRDIHDECLSI